MGTRKYFLVRSTEKRIVRFQRLLASDDLRRLPEYSMNYREHSGSGGSP